MVSAKLLRGMEGGREEGEEGRREEDIVRGEGRVGKREGEGVEVERGNMRRGIVEGKNNSRYFEIINHLTYFYTWDLGDFNGRLYHSVSGYVRQVAPGVTGPRRFAVNMTYTGTT